MANSVQFDANWMKILRDIKSLESKGRQLQKDFVDIASSGILEVIKNNTPTNSGELRKSWRIAEKKLKYFIITTDLPDIFLAVRNGTAPRTIVAKNGKALHFFVGNQEFFRVRVNHKGSLPNDFISPIVKAMDEMLETLILSLVKKYWKITDGIKAQKVTKYNISKTVGLTGTNFNKRRGRGGQIQKAKTGRKRFRRVLKRTRRTGQFITSKNTKVG